MFLLSSLLRSPLRIPAFAFLNEYFAHPWSRIHFYKVPMRENKLTTSVATLKTRRSRRLSGASHLRGSRAGPERRESSSMCHFVNRPIAVRNGEHDRRRRTRQRQTNRFPTRRYRTLCRVSRRLGRSRPLSPLD